MADPQFTPEQLEQMARAQAKITEEQRKQKALSEEIADTYDVIEKDLDSISKLINNQLKQQGASARQISEIKSIYSSLNRTNRELQYLNDKFYEGTLKTKEISSQLNTLNRTETVIRRQINVALDKGDKTLAAKFQKELRILEKERQQAEVLKQQNEYVDKRVGLTGKLLHGLEKIPILGDAIDFEEINTSMRNAVGNTNVFAAGIKTAGKQLKEGLRDPLVQFALLSAFYTKIVKAAYEHNQFITDTARTLGTSKENAQGLYDSAFQYAGVAHDSFVTAKDLLEAQTKLNQELGTAVNLGNQNAEAFGRLTHFYKLSEQSSAKLVQLGQEQGKNGLDILNAAAKTYVTQKAQLGGTIAFNKVLDQVANVSDDIYIRFKGNPEAIAKAVMQADRLGLTLEKVNQIGESLLNFEQSIEAELKAELLTGKSINLEKARELALMGDTENLAKEIANQVGNIHQFEKMNVIQRKAYAEAMGMSVQEMASMLRKQEFEAKLSKEAKESAKATLEYADKHGIKMDAALRAQYEQKSLSEEQHEVFKKMNEILGKIMQGPMSKFIGMLEKALHVVNNIFEGFSKFTGGVLGSALGSVLLGAPLLIGATRLVATGIKSMLLGPRGSSPLNPMFVEDITGSGGGGGGILDNLMPGGKGKSLMQRGGFGRGRGMTLGRSLGGGLKGFGFGTAVSLGADVMASNMQEGSTERAITEGVSTTAGYAGTGALIGSVVPGIGTAVGAIIGGSIGAIKSYFDSENEKREIEKREREEAKASADRMDKLVQSINDISQRPLVFNAGTDMIGRLQTSQRQYGAPSFAG